MWLGAGGGKPALGSAGGEEQKLIPWASPCCFSPPVLFCGLSAAADIDTLMPESES